MAKNIYVGVGGKARKVKQLYVGVAGKARKVKKVYVGVGGKARLVYAYVYATNLYFSCRGNVGEELGLEAGFKGWAAEISAVFIPNDTTEKKIIKWELLRYNDYSSGIIGATIKSTTNTTCVIEKTVWYSGQATLKATTSNGITAQTKIHWGSSNFDGQWHLGD